MFEFSSIPYLLNIAKRVEYSGEVTGLMADGSVASTLLCFMVTSVVGKYNDVVSLYLMSRLYSIKTTGLFERGDDFAEDSVVERLCHFCRELCIYQQAEEG